MTQEITTFGYHFLSEEMRPAHGAEPAWSVGERRDLEGDIGICDFGYHASPTPSQALPYAPGPMLTLVQLYGDISYETDKLVARGRRIIAVTDVRPLNAEWISSVMATLNGAYGLAGVMRTVAHHLLAKQTVPVELRDALQDMPRPKSGTKESFIWSIGIWPNDIHEAILAATKDDTRKVGWTETRYNKLCYEALVEAQKASIAAQPAVV